MVFATRQYNTLQIMDNRAGSAIGQMRLNGAIGHIRPEVEPISRIARSWEVFNRRVQDETID